MGTLKKDNYEAVCNFCSIGCKVNFKVINNEIYYVANDGEMVGDSHNKGYLCVKGRFAHRYMMEKNRLIKPLLKDGDQQVKTGWENAVNVTAEKLKTVIDKHGPDSVALFASP